MQEESISDFSSLSRDFFFFFFCGLRHPVTESTTEENVAEEE